MPKVKIYSTPSCVYCKMAKQFLVKYAVAYEEVNVAEDQVARDEMIRKSRQMGVPVIEIGEEVFVGFDRDGLSKALHLES